MAATGGDGGGSSSSSRASSPRGLVGDRLPQPHDLVVLEDPVEELDVRLAADVELLAEVCEHALLALLV